MTRRLYLDESKLAEIGFDQAMIATFRKLTEFVALVSQVDTTDADLTTLTAQFVIEQANIDAAESAIDDLEDGSTVIPTYVQKDQEAAPSITVYTGQDVSATYVESEAQATDDAVAALSATVDDLIGKLQDAEVLT